MSHWKPKQGPATFRGVSFFVASNEASGGRETVSHPIPFTEGAHYTEDMGRRSPRFRVEGYVLGAEYEAARDALIAALDTPGPGELVHPYFGTRRVAVGGYTVRQQVMPGGVASFSIEFIETLTEPIKPTVTVDVVSVVDARARATKQASAAQFLAASSSTTEEVSAGARAQGQALVGAMAAVLDRSPIPSALRATFNQALTLSPTGTFTTASEFLVVSLASIFDAYATVVGAVEAPARALLRLFAFDPGPPPAGTTPAALAARAEFDALATFIRRLSIAYAAEAIVRQSFDTYATAVTARTELTDVIDAHLFAAADDVYPALADLRGALVDAVPGPDSNLPRLQTVTPPVTVPSLVLAHRLYGHLDREQDLIDRNRIRHPLFVPGGVPLEVLTDE